MDRVTRCFLYHKFPGYWSKWTLAVFAISRKDANNYIKSVMKGGTFAGEVTGESVKADCGATTEAAQAAIRSLNERTDV